MENPPQIEAPTPIRSGNLNNVPRGSVNLAEAENVFASIDLMTRLAGEAGSPRFVSVEAVVPTTLFFSRI